ncbi:MAG: hypothetical protein K6G16_04330, partial [Lachnospiraceae bacterium]|nr:hypothetical protein [Lachnospiraceae bacterium]
QVITRDLEEGKRVRAAVPDDLVHFIRQYDTDVILAYGRDIVAYGYYNEVHEKMELPETIDMEALALALREAEVDFLVLRKDKPVDRDPGEAAWQCVEETEDYRIYTDAQRKEGA